MGVSGLCHCCLLTNVYGSCHDKKLSDPSERASIVFSTCRSWASYSEPLSLQPSDLDGEGHEGVAAVWLGQDYHLYVPQHYVDAGDAPVAAIDGHPVQIPALVLDHPPVPDRVAFEQAVRVHPGFAQHGQGVLRNDLPAQREETRIVLVHQSFLARP